MDADFVARCSAWPAAAAYIAAVACSLPPGTSRRQACFRSLWTAGWAALLAHIVICLGWVHDWSWTAAYIHTAERTRAATGWNSGVGIWFNVLAAVVWGIDVLSLWIATSGQHQLWKAFRWTARVYLGFIMFNAIVVFGSRFANCIGCLICMGLAACALKSFCRRRVSGPDQS